MALSPQWKIYDPDGCYQAATKEPEPALVLVQFFGEGSTIRVNHKTIVWRHGYEAAVDSYEAAVEIMEGRITRSIKPARGE